MTDGPVVLDMDRLTPTQRDVLGQIALGNDGGHNPRTIAALKRMGLIVGHLDDGESFGVRVTRYELPIPVHMQWCEWCANQPDDEGNDQ